MGYATTWFNAWLHIFLLKSLLICDYINPSYEAVMLASNDMLICDLIVVPVPQLDTFVFCKSRGPIGSFQLDDKYVSFVKYFSNLFKFIRSNVLKLRLE